MGDRDLLRVLLLNDAGDQVVLALREEPPAATRRLMAALGVRVEIRPDGIAADRAGVDAVERLVRVEQGEPMTFLGTKAKGERTLGGEIPVRDQVAKHQAFLDEQPVATLCGVYGCDWKFNGAANAGREEFAAHRLAEHPTVIKAQRKLGRAAEAQQVDGLRLAAAERGDALQRLEERPGGVSTETAIELLAEVPGVAAAAEPQAEPVAVLRQRPTRWTSELAIAAIQAFAAEHGRPPSVRETIGNRLLPSAGTVRCLGLTWAEIIEQSGFERPTRGGVKRAPLEDASSGRADSQPAARGHARPAVGGVLDEQGPGIRARAPGADGRPSADAVTEPRAEVSRVASGENADPGQDPAGLSPASSPLDAEQAPEPIVVQAASELLGGEAPPSDEALRVRYLEQLIERIGQADVEISTAYLDRVERLLGIKEAA